MDKILEMAREIWPTISDNTRILVQGPPREITYPATWWDRYKRNHFTKFLLEYFPIRQVTKVRDRPRKITLPILSRLPIDSFCAPMFDRIEIELRIQPNGLDAGYNHKLDILYVSRQSVNDFTCECVI